MLYLDHDYKNDCEHKIEYDHLTEISPYASSFIQLFTNITPTALSNIGKVYKSTDDVYLIKMKNTSTALSAILLNENCSIIEISPGLYKLIVYTVQNGGE